MPPTAHQCPGRIDLSELTSPVSASFDNESPFDDYYSKKGIFLGSDSLGNAMRLIDEQDFNKIKKANNGRTGTVKARNELRNSNKSKVIIDKTSGKFIEQMWKESYSHIERGETDSNGNFRQEIRRAIVLDLKKAEVRLHLPDSSLKKDPTKTPDNYSSFRSYSFSRTIMYADSPSFNLLIIGQIHTHPNREYERDGTKWEQTPKRNYEDANYSTRWKMPVFYVNRNEMDFIHPVTDSCIDNFIPMHEEVFNPKFKIGTYAFKVYSAQRRVGAPGE